MSVLLSPDEIEARYRLLCRVAAGEPAAAGAAAINDEFDALQQLVRHDLMELARHGAPADFSQIVAALEEGLGQLQQLCSFPMLTGKKTVGVGGAFSAGKSSLINALLGQQLLAVEIDPTTALPTYLLRHQQSLILGLNRLLQKVELSKSEFLSLTHGEQEVYGSNAGAMLQSALYALPEFPWPALALIDVPGYSKPDGNVLKARTDARIAHAQLSAAQAVIWVVSVEAGAISEQDLVFLASLPREMACLIVVSRADKRDPQSVAAVVKGIGEAVSARGIAVLAVVPVSTRDSQAYPLSAVREQLQRWNDELPAIGPAERFKSQFFRYERYLAHEAQQRRRQLGLMKRILALSTEVEAQHDAGELLAEMQLALEWALSQAADLQAFQQRFFAHLHTLVQASGMALPAGAGAGQGCLPPLDLLLLLRALHAPGHASQVHRRHLALLSRPADATRRASLLRRTSQRYLPLLQPYSAAAEASNAACLLHQGSRPATVRILSF